MNKLIMMLILVGLGFLSFVDQGNCANEKSYIERDGLPNLFSKLSAGDDVTIAYFGGSITAQPGYRTQTFQWFKETWPNVNFIQVNAAIGGTGSSLGAFRLYNDVLSKNPDLMFIEFAVNDYRVAVESFDDVVASVEGIVRQVIKNNPNTDMCFVYTITEQVLNDMKAGGGFTSMLAHEAVAEHYGIPSINMGLAVAKMEAAGKLVMKGPKGKLEAVSGESLNVLADMPVNDKGQVVFAKDGVHPYPNSGHKIYTDTVVRALPLMKGGQIGPHHLSVPISVNNLEKAKMVSLSDVELFGDWKQYDWGSSLLSLGLKNRMNDVRVANKPGDFIAFKFKGTMVGYYDIMGPDTGVIETDIDGMKSYMSRFDKYCTYYRISSSAMNVEDGVHSVKFTLTDREIDKEAVLKQRGSSMDDPSRFADKRWYVGSVMLIGDLIVE